MRRTTLVVGAFALALVVGRLDAQSRPDFSGKWTLVSSTPANSHALGLEFTITQDATTFALDQIGYSIRGSSGGGSTSTPFPIRTIYTLDGADHPRETIASPPVVTPRGDPATRMTVTTEESISRAIWAGRQLVIMTYNRLKTTWPSRTPPVSTQRQTVRQALSLDGDGTLIVESLIVAEPAMWQEREQPSPIPVRSVYKKN